MKDKLHSMQFIYLHTVLCYEPFRSLTSIETGSRLQSKSTAWLTEYVTSSNTYVAGSEAGQLTYMYVWALCNSNGIHNEA